MNDLEFQCPVCGAEVHPNARGCRSCGARRESHGWGQPASREGLDLPGDDDDDFDYEEFIAREFGEGTKKGLGGMPPKKLFWWIVAVVTLIAFFFAFVV